MPEGDESFDIRVKKIEGNESTYIYEQVHHSSEGTVEVPVSGSEDAVFQIFVNGELYGTKP